MEKQFKRRCNGIAEDLAAVIGLTNTLLLCGTRGGDSLYVPGQATPGHMLETLLGQTAFQRMVEEWGGTSFTVPALSDFGRYQRIRKCAELVGQGKSLHAIAKVTGVTYQQVKNDRRAAEMLGILPLVLMGRVKVRSDAEVIEQLQLPGV